MKVLSPTVTVPPVRCRRRRRSVAELPVKVLPRTVAVPRVVVDAAAEEVAELSVKVLPLTVVVPPFCRCRRRRRGVAGEGAVAHRRRPAISFLMPPPSLPAELLAKVLSLTVVSPSSRGRRQRGEELPVKVLPRTVTVPPGPLSRPPPRKPAQLPVKVLSLTVAVPPLSFSRPPPRRRCCRRKRCR